MRSSATRAGIEETVLVFDLGGDVCDVSLQCTEFGVINVLAMAGATHVGGEDFTDRMVAHFVAEFERKFDRDVKGNTRALCRLRTACERAKRELSSAMTSTIEIDSLVKGIDFRSTITRARFEELNDDLFRKCMDVVGQVLRDAKKDKGQIHEVLLVGGSSRIPKVQQLLQDFFNGKELNKSLNPDEAVAYGAAVQAAILSGECLSDWLVMPVTPQSLGVETTSTDGVMTVVVPRGKMYPIKKEQVLSMRVKEPRGGLIRVYEGKYNMARDNQFLGQIDLSGFPLAPDGILEVKVIFSIDARYMVDVSVEDEAETFKTRDRERKAQLEARNALEEYLFRMRGMAQDDKVMLAPADRLAIRSVVDAAAGWLEHNPMAGKGELINALKEAERLCGLIIARMGQYGHSS
eukprot:jgi/Mesvir1/16955/Mv15805-RA.1